MGWGLFGASITPAIALATLVLHLVYGMTLAALGRLVERRSAPSQARRAAGASA